MGKKYNVKEYIIFILVICLEMDMENVFAKLPKALNFDILIIFSYSIVFKSLRFTILAVRYLFHLFR